MKKFSVAPGDKNDPSLVEIDGGLIKEIHLSTVFSYDHTTFS